MQCSFLRIHSTCSARVGNDFGNFLEGLVGLAGTDHVFISETYLTQLYIIIMTLLVHFEAPPLSHPQ